jgi:hypothetical protein
MAGRFVILEHDWPAPHYDLMLEVGEKLRTWRLAKLPVLGRLSAAEAIFDHRLLYLDYEGPVSGGRGTVKRWDRGTYEGKVEGAEAITIKLHGDRLEGVLRLSRVGDVWEAQVDVE